MRTQTRLMLEILLTSIRTCIRIPIDCSHLRVLEALVGCVVVPDANDRDVLACTHKPREQGWGHGQGQQARDTPGHKPMGVSLSNMQRWAPAPARHDHHGCLLWPTQPPTSCSRPSDPTTQASTMLQEPCHHLATLFPPSHRVSAQPPVSTQQPCPGHLACSTLYHTPSLEHFAWGACATQIFRAYTRATDR